MATFGEMQTYVSKRLLDANNTAITSSDVAASINNSIRYWKYRRFWFNSVSDTVTLTLNDGTIPQTGDFLVPVGGGFFIEYSSQRWPLQKVSADCYHDTYLDNGYGEPRIYARMGQAYECYPLPDRAYTVRRDILKDYSDLSDGSDTNDFTDNADRLINLWSLADLTAELRQDLEMENYYRNAARDEYRQLGVMSAKSNGSGTLTLNSFLTA